MTTREAFEAQIRKQFPTANEELLLGKLSNGRYVSLVTEHAWLAYQAATAAALERAAEVCEAIENGEKPDGSIAAGLSWECADAIRALKESKE